MTGPLRVKLRMSYGLEDVLRLRNEEKRIGTNIASLVLLPVCFFWGVTGFDD